MKGKKKKATYISLKSSEFSKFKNRIIDIIIRLYIWVTCSFVDKASYLCHKSCLANIL